jgi:hypothetical protein
MKKLLGLTLTLASFGFVAAPTEAKAAETNLARAESATAYAPAPQWGRRSRYRRVRVVNQSRLVRVGRRVYRETYQIRYFPNGRTQTRLISRVRVR